MQTQLQPAQLRCEYLSNPLGIDVLEPRLNWILASVERGQRQAAYQVLVASSKTQLDADQGDCWDSGKVNSSQSISVIYGGRPLRSGKRYWWKVRTWDSTAKGIGEPSAYSQPAWWEMGLLEPTDWLGTWIGLDRARTQELLPATYIRKTISLGQPVHRARLYITAKGLYQARINGQRVGNAVLAPGWTDYDKRIQYQTYDVTDLLQQGENAIGVILGEGWYSGTVGFIRGPLGTNSRHYGSRPQILAQLMLEYADGTAQAIVSDGSWKGTVGPIVFSDLLMGETYDARKELPGWDTPGFDDSGWERLSTAEQGQAQLVADRAQPVQVTQEITPTRIAQPQPGTYIFDLGQNMVGWVRLKVTGSAGQSVRLRFAEMLNPDGTIYTANLRTAGATDTYILKGDREEIFEPHFTFHGFRYVEVSGYPGTPALDALTGCVVHSATPPVGTFECSNPMIDQLQRNIVWGQRGNFLSIPTDCPQRDERLGWTADAQIFMRTACCNMDVAAFFTKWMVDVADAQSPNGGFSDVAPRLTVLSDGAPAWGDAGVIVPWTMYQVYGDTRMIERHWDAMVRWMEYLRQASPGFLWTGRLGNNYGDWLSIEADTPKEVIATAYYAYDAKLMSKMARAIGRQADAEKYERLFEAIKAAFNKAYVGVDGRIMGETQTCYVLALHMNLLPDDKRSTAVQHLVADIERREGHLSTGFVGVGYLLPVLAEADRLDLAYRLLNNDTFPSWSYSIKHGATTIWERWDGWTEERGFQTPSMNSFNHYALGSVGEWLYRYVAGIDVDPQRPGYEHIILQPRPGGGLTHARAEYASIRGMIISEWRIEDGIFKLDVTIPTNTTATIYVPASEKADVTEGGKPMDEVTGVRFLRSADRAAVFEVESGTYEFASTGAEIPGAVGHVATSNAR